jgi:hypothetical protein
VDALLEEAMLLLPGSLSLSLSLLSLFLSLHFSLSLSLSLFYLTISLSPPPLSFFRLLSLSTTLLRTSTAAVRALRTTAFALLRMRPIRLRMRTRGPRALFKRLPL